MNIEYIKVFASEDSAQKLSAVLTCCEQCFSPQDQPKSSIQHQNFHSASWFPVLSYHVLNTHLFFLSSELRHPQLVLVLQFLRRLKPLQETQVVETLAVEELCLHHSHLLLTTVQSQVGETLAELAPCYIAHVVSGWVRVCVCVFVCWMLLSNEIFDLK